MYQRRFCDYLWHFLGNGLDICVAHRGQLSVVCDEIEMQPEKIGNIPVI